MFAKPKKVEMFNIKSRAAALGLSLTEMLNEANKRTGRGMRLNEFAGARSGKDRTACAIQTLETVNRILKELEHPAE